MYTVRFCLLELYPCYRGSERLGEYMEEKQRKCVPRGELSPNPSPGVRCDLRMTRTSWLLYPYGIILATAYGTTSFPSSSTSRENNPTITTKTYATGGAGGSSSMSGLSSSTALDFREMMRKERTLALKRQGEKAAANRTGGDALARMRCVELFC